MPTVNLARFLFALPTAFVATSGAQLPLRHPAEAIELRFARSQPVISYRLVVDTADLTRFDVEIRVRNAPDTFRLAMPAHPEYDERSWRWVADLRIESGSGNATIVRLDSAVWRVRATGGQSVIRYRVNIPASPRSPRAAWRPFLSRTGGLIGGPYGVMYVVGAELAPSHIMVEVPAGWQIVTGLEPTSDPRTYSASSADVLADSPFLVGRLRSWRFAIDDVPHRVVYWASPEAASFDTTALVAGIERLARQAVALFGRAPWREYTFMLQDEAYGALEHANSVTLGAPSAALHENPGDPLQEIAHEFFHAWNLMRIRPAEYRGIGYREQPPTSGLWFAEGMSMFYSDLLLRRAGVSAGSSTRIAHLESLIARYLANSGNARFSAERVSQVAYNSQPGALGDHDASTHLQGEVLGALLDLIVRDATDGRRSLDDVMRLMLERFSGERGYTGRDIERVVGEVCGCNVGPLFDAHVRGGGTTIDFDRYLRLIGLRARVAWAPAVGRDGSSAPDLRLYAWQAPPDSALRLTVTEATSVWSRAGLHSRDQVEQVNGVAVHTWPEFRSLISRLRIGDTVRVDLRRAEGIVSRTVLITGYDRPNVRLEETPGVTDRQRRLKAEWMAGRP